MLLDNNAATVSLEVRQHGDDAESHSWELDERKEKTP
jgi:hypothetical protein